jgi:hypothetical protein
MRLDKKTALKKRGKACEIRAEMRFMFVEQYNNARANSDGFEALIHVAKNHLKNTFKEKTGYI